ncbi:MAG: hypothetical protein LBS79_09105 [Tannerella sp.]|jgi:hypothetical protein|nr:hypothetical protein [Tannerella sp.]
MKEAWVLLSGFRAEYPASVKMLAPVLPHRRKTWSPATRFRTILTHYDSYPAHRDAQITRWDAQINEMLMKKRSDRQAKDPWNAIESVIIP